MNTAVETSLRYRQKARRRADILAAGRQLFIQQGYTATSMEKIAELAEVGIATVYNYFGTKGQLLADVLQPDVDRLFEQAEAVLAQPPEDPGSGVLSLIDIYWKFQGNWEHKDLLVAAMGPGLSAERALDELSTAAESQVKKQLGTLLSNYQRAGKARADIDINDATLIIFYIFNQHYIQSISQETVGFSAMKAAMDRQIRFVVSAITH